MTQNGAGRMGARRTHHAAALAMAAGAFAFSLGIGPGPAQARSPDELDSFVWLPGHRPLAESVAVAAIGEWVWNDGVGSIPLYAAPEGAPVLWLEPGLSNIRAGFADSGDESWTTPRAFAPLLCIGSGPACAALSFPITARQPGWIQIAYDVARDSRAWLRRSDLAGTWPGLLEPAAAALGLEPEELSTEVVPWPWLAGQAIEFRAEPADAAPVVARYRIQSAGFGPPEPLRLLRVRDGWAELARWVCPLGADEEAASLGWTRLRDARGVLLFWLWSTDCE